MRMRGNFGARISGKFDANTQHSERICGKENSPYTSSVLIKTLFKRLQLSSGKIAYFFDAGAYLSEASLIFF